MQQINQTIIKSTPISVTTLHRSVALCRSSFESLVHEKISPPYWVNCFYGGEHGIRLARLRAFGRRRSEPSTGRLLCTASPSNPLPIKLKKSAHPDGWTVFCWRRARDSNPRNRFSSSHDFQSCSFDQLGQLSITVKQRSLLYITIRKKSSLF